MNFKKHIMYNKEKNPVFELQKNTKNIRNFCILAHVDHGTEKTYLNKL